MTNKLRTVHINSVEWKYAISNGNVRIYEPGTKQIKATVPFRDLYYIAFSPSDVKKYIIDNLI
jgi:hypothetical protein